MGGAEGEEEVFLRVVEVWLESDAGVVFFLRYGGGTEVDAVVLCAGLEHYALWGDGGEGEGLEEVLEEEDWTFSKDRKGEMGGEEAVFKEVDCRMEGLVEVWMDKTLGGRR